VSLISWVKDTFEQETKDEMALKKVPQLSVSLKLVKRYTRHSQIF
jgi:ferritin-like metal-binding protein YciE